MSTAAYLIACVLLIGTSIESEAGVVLKAGIESGVNISDNIALQGDGNESSDVVLQLKPSINLVSKSRRSTVALDYALQNLSYVRNTDANSIFHQFSAIDQATFVPETFFLDTDISRTQFSSQPNEKSSFGNFNLSERHNVTRASLAPTLKLHYSNLAQGQVKYLAGHVSLDNVASSSDLHQLRARFNSGSAFQRFRWETTYNRVREIRQDPGLPDIYYKDAKASAEYAVIRGIYLKSEIGSYESEYTASRFSSKNGRYQSYGVRIKPTRRFNLAVVGGPDYRSANLDFKPTPRTRIYGFWQDNEFGLAYGNKALASFILKLRHIEWRLSYSDTVTSIQQLILTQSTVNANLQTFEVTDYLFRQKQTSLAVNRHGKRIDAGVKFFVDRREFEITQGNSPAAVAGFTTSLAWQLDGRLICFVDTHNEYRKTDTEVKAGRLESFSTGFQLKKRRNVSASLRYRYTVQSSPLVKSSDYIENSIMLTASYMR